MVNKSLIEALDVVDDTQKLMTLICARVFGNGENALQKARGMSDAFLASLFVSLGRENTQNIIDRMSEQLCLIKEA